MQNEASVEIDRPIEDVFRLTNNHVAEWSIVVVEDDVIDRTPNGLGTTFRTVTEENGKRMEFQGVVTHYEPPYASAVRLTGDMFDIDAAYSFEDLRGRTRVTQMSIVHGKGVLKVIFALFGWLMKKASCDATNNELLSLKKFCEEYSGPITE